MNEWAYKQRLEQALQGAVEAYNQAAIELNQTQAEVAKERFQFFDKLAIGCGATIAATVSFLGSHALKPRWAMRWALASLLVAVCAAWFRNFRYPGYLILVKHKAWIQSGRDEQRSRDALIQNDILQAMTAAAPISKAEWTQHHMKTDGWFGDLIEEKERAERRRVRESRWAELAALAAAIIAAGLLVLIAFRTF